jgi:hypothetical protein
MESQRKETKSATHWSEGDGDGEAAVGWGGGGDGGTVGAGDRADDGQAETVAVGVVDAPGVEALEGLEEAVDLTG